MASLCAVCNAVFVALLAVFVGNCQFTEIARNFLF